jgi:hypothetical protein
VYKHPLADELFGIRDMFITKAMKHKFAGFANAQKEMLINKKANGTGRQDLVEKYGYDTKFASHSIRLLSKAIETHETGKYETISSNVHHLKDVRAGKFSLEQVLTEIDLLDKRLNYLYEHSDKIPHSPDFNKINKWLVGFNEKAVKTLDREDFFRESDKEGFKGILKKFIYLINT